jgi:moderate conductance mechanosensitive channel
MRPLAVTVQLLSSDLKGYLSIVCATRIRPAGFRNAADCLLAELRGRRLLGVLILVLEFVALRAGIEWIFRRATARPQQRIAALPSETVTERVRAMGLRLAFGLSEIAI